jgi:uncharacterized membrane protein (UPF0127 family)
MGHNQRLKRDQKKQLFIGICLLIVLIGGWGIFQNWYQQRGQVSAQFISADGKARGTYHLEVADEPDEQSKGLMFRKSLAPKSGMIFIHKTDENHSFWMKNTFISLDMIFVDASKRIVGILPSVPILNEEPRQVDKPSRFVIELAAGEASKSGLQVGDSIAF